MDLYAGVPPKNCLKKV